MQKQSDWDISVEELKQMRDDGKEFVLIDVREEHEHVVCNLGGKLIPLGQLEAALHDLDRSAHMVVHCKSGGRSAMAVQMMRDVGFENVWNVHGSLLAWRDRIDPDFPEP
jgi:rhodanese-related sulfurtransferase